MAPKGKRTPSTAPAGTKQAPARKQVNKPKAGRGCFAIVFLLLIPTLIAVGLAFTSVTCTRGDEYAEQLGGSEAAAQCKIVRSTSAAVRQMVDEAQEAATKAVGEETLAKAKTQYNAAYDAAAAPLDEAAEAVYTKLTLPKDDPNAVAGRRFIAFGVTLLLIPLMFVFLPFFHVILLIALYFAVYPNAAIEWVWYIQKDLVVMEPIITRVLQSFKSIGIDFGI